MANILAKSAILGWPQHSDPNCHERADAFSSTPDFEYAGTHILLDCWDGTGFDDIKLIEAALRKAVDIAGATLLHIHLHHFTPNGGVSGVAVLAESHISIHTWPEHNYAALDIFMCGACQPHLAVPIFEEAFNTHNIQVTEQLRGKIPIVPKPSP